MPVLQAFGRTFKITVEVDGKAKEEFVDSRGQTWIAVEPGSAFQVKAVVEEDLRVTGKNYHRLQLTLDGQDVYWYCFDARAKTQTFVGYSFTAKNLALAVADFIVIFSGSAIVGGVCAAFTALTLRMLRADSDADEGAAATSRTLQLVTLCAAIWAPTFLAELVELSGIVATLFAAIGVRHWATPNLQSSSTVDAKPVANAVLSTLAHLADTIIFLYLGLSVPACVEIMTSTPSTRRLLDGVAVSIPHRSTEPGRPRHRREMT